MRKINEQLYDKKLDNLDEINKYLETQTTETVERRNGIYE